MPTCNVDANSCVCFIYHAINDKQTAHLDVTDCEAAGQGILMSVFPSLAWHYCLQ